ADADLVVLLRKEDDELVQEAGFDRASLNGHLQPIPLAEDQASRLALELGEPVLRSPEPLSAGAGPSVGLGAIRHSARVPLRTERETSALLLFLGRRRGGPFTRDDAALLEVLAHQAAIAIHNAELYERAQKTARRLQVGVDVALEVAARLEPDEVVERILRRALEAVEADRATLGRMEGGFECTILGSVDRTEDQAPVGRTV